MSSIAVIHLVWAPFGIEPFRNFMQSYIEHSAGIGHDLIILFKGFSSDEETIEYRTLLKNVNFLSLFIKDAPFDIGAYRIAADTFSYDWYFFLNSNSVILVDDWLVKFYYYASQPNVGLTGATGSYESIYHNNFGSNIFLEDIITSWRRFFFSGGTFYRRLRKVVSPFLTRPRLYYWFGPFPNCNIRTNAFMVSKKVLNRVKWRKISAKFDALVFESGRKSLSKQVVSMGYELLIVGRNGKAYKKDAFHLSNTFRCCNQENLVIADNQTSSYLAADDDRKLLSALKAWGDYANVYGKVQDNNEPY